MMFIILLGTLFQSPKANPVPVDDNFQNRQLSEVLNDLGERYQVFISYQSRLIKDIQVDFEFRTEESLDMAVKRLLTHTGLNYEFYEKQYLIIYKNDRDGTRNARKIQKKIKQIKRLEEKGNLNVVLNSSNIHKRNVAILNSVKERIEKTVSGTITDEAGEPLIGATVVARGTTQGTITDSEGQYSLTVEDQVTKLLVSYVGYASQEVSIDNRSTVNITLSEADMNLDEVVISALGISRDKRALGYSVTELDGDAVSKVKESNLASSLAGKVAGVVVYKNTSGAGGSARVIIRGNNSLTGNNEPLYVVDGVPIDNSNLAGSGAGEFNVPDYGNGISDINPDDIESISILKGPNAAALYGSRASNGVVLITTKKGTRGRGLGISLSSSITLETPLVLPEFQNEYGRGTDGNFPQLNPSDDLATQVNVVGGTSSWGPKFDNSSQLAYNGMQRPYTAQPDNVRNFFETGSTFINTVALSGGTDKTSVRFSYTNSDIQSILPNSSVQRNNFNLRGSASLGKRLSVDTKITYFLQEAQNRASQGSEGLMAYVWPMARNVALSDLMVYQDIENPINPADPYRVIAPTSNGGNPYWMLYNNRQADTRSRVNGFVKLDYQITDWLSAFARAGTDDISQNLETVTANGNHFFTTGRIGFQDTDRTETNYDFLLMLNKNLGDRFNLSANAGGNSRRSTFRRSSINGSDFKIPGRYFLNNTDGTRIVANQSDLIEKRVNSLYGSASLSFDDMIYVDFTGRNDWSSALAAENRSYFYSSASVSLLLDKLFRMDETTVNLLKLRGSTANVGNDTDPLQIMNVFSVAANGYLGNVQINRPNIRFSESLRPEDIRTTEAGLEFRLFRNRLYGDLSVYQITTKDLIFDVPVDPGTGFSFFRENIGEITNKGIEFLLGGTPAKTANFRWDISANVSRNRNELVSLIEGQENFNFSSSNGGIVDVRAQVDGGYGDIYATTWLRNDAGQLILTTEGRPQATSERELFGNYQPDLTGGFTNTFRFKNISLNALIDFRIGGEVFNFTEIGMDASGVSRRSLEYRESGILVDGVVEEADGTFSPNTTTISAQDYWQAVSSIGSEYIFDQTNVRLRELSVSYSLPKGFLSDVFVSSPSISLIGRNLFFLYKNVDNFDPESSYATGNFSQGVLWYALPTTRSIGASLNLNF
ncbi:MAG: SusC/RagA family TonB-linked outer membrane protein [Bacteroidota bacterium]